MKCQFSVNLSLFIQLLYHIWSFVVDTHRDSIHNDFHNCWSDVTVSCTQKEHSQILTYCHSFHSLCSFSSSSFYPMHKTWCTKLKKQTNNNLHTQPAALFVHTSWSYIVFTVVPSRVQLFVKERLYPGLLEVFGFLLHCKRLPLWAGRRHTCRELCTHNHKTTPCSFVKCCAAQFALAGAEARIHFTSCVRKSVRGFSKRTFLPKALFTFEVPWRLSSGATCGLCSSRKSMKALGGFLMYVRSSLSCCPWFSSLRHRSRWRAQASTG